MIKKYPGWQYGFTEEEGRKLLRLVQACQSAGVSTSFDDLARLCSRFNINQFADFELPPLEGIGFWERLWWRILDLLDYLGRFIKKKRRPTGY